MFLNLCVDYTIKYLYTQSYLYIIFQWLFFFFLFFLQTHRLKQAFKVDATDDLSDIHCVLYPEREVERVWKQLLVRDNICFFLLCVYTEESIGYTDFFILFFKFFQVLDNPASWPYSSEGRRRLMHRMLKLSSKSACRTEAITYCAQKAEQHRNEIYAREEQQRNERDEL